MPSDSLDLDYTHLDALPPTARDALCSLLEDDVPDWYRYNPADVLWLLATVVAERPACMFDQCHFVSDAPDDFDCPIARVVEGIPLPTGRKRFSCPAEEWYSVEPNRYPELVDETVIARFFTVGHDAEFIDWFNNQESSTVPDDKHVYVGRALGFPEDAIEAFVSDDWTGTDGPRDIIKAGLDDCPNPRYIDFAPYVPAPTEEAVREAIETGKHYADVARQIARDYPEYAALTDLIDRALPDDDEWSHWLREDEPETHEGSDE